MHRSKTDCNCQSCTLVWMCSLKFKFWKDSNRCVFCHVWKKLSQSLWFLCPDSLSKWLSGRLLWLALMSSFCIHLENKKLYFRQLIYIYIELRYVINLLEFHSNRFAQEDLTNYIYEQSNWSDIQDLTWRPFSKVGFKCIFGLKNIFFYL